MNWILSSQFKKIHAAKYATIYRYHNLFENIFVQRDKIRKINGKLYSTLFQSADNLMIGELLNLMVWMLQYIVIYIKHKIFTVFCPWNVELSFQTSYVFSYFDYSFIQVHLVIVFY